MTGPFRLLAHNRCWLAATAHLLCWLAFSHVASSHLFLALLFSRVCSRPGLATAAYICCGVLGTWIYRWTRLWAFLPVLKDVSSAQLLEHSWTSVGSALSARELQLFCGPAAARGILLLSLLLFMTIVIIQAIKHCYMAFQGSNMKQKVNVKH